MEFIKVFLFLVSLNEVFCTNFNLTAYLPEKWKSAFKEVIINPDAGLNIYQFLVKYNYPVETHWVTTEDGYVLRMHRIVGGQNNTYYKANNKPVALLMHGLCGSSIDWVNMGPKNGLGLVLADAGYDVWMGNNRGNTWSRQHVFMDPNTDENFWDYSFELSGYYDLPAKIDYILKKSGQQKLFYVGLSQGTSQFFAMAALRPEYNKKITLMSALAPVAYMGHLKSLLIRAAADNMESLSKIVDALHWHEFFKYNKLVSELAALLSSDGSPLQDVITKFVFLVCGSDDQQFNRTTLPVVVSNTPAGMSFNMLKHFSQQILTGYFRRYDYGANKNVERYNSEIPPNINISAITAPIALYYGQNDLLAVVEDVERLASELPNLAKKQLIENKLWSHFDFMVGKDIYKVVYQDLIAHQQQFIDNGKTTTTESPKGSGSRNIQSVFVIIIIVSVCILSF